MVLEGILYSGDDRMEYIKEKEEERERDRDRERRKSDGKKRERETETEREEKVMGRREKGRKGGVDEGMN